MCGEIDDAMKREMTLRQLPSGGGGRGGGGRGGGGVLSHTYETFHAGYSRVWTGGKGGTCCWSGLMWIRRKDVRVILNRSGTKKGTRVGSGELSSCQKC